MGYVTKVKVEGEGRDKVSQELTKMRQNTKYTFADVMIFNLHRNYPQQRSNTIQRSNYRSNKVYWKSMFTNKQWECGITIIITVCHNTVYYSSTISCNYIALATRECFQLNAVLISSWSNRTCTPLFHNETQRHNYTRSLLPN